MAKAQSTSQGNSLEKIIAYFNITPYLNKRDSEALRKKLRLTESDLQRYDGKDFEERFYLMLLFRDNIECIIPFDEQIAKILNIPSPDVFLVLKTGEKMLIELKTSSQFTKKISVTRINKQIAFSKILGYPLYYLYSMNDAWGLFTAEYLLEKNGRIAIHDFVDHSKFEDVFRIGLLDIPEGFTISCISSSKVKNTVGISSRYGTPIKYVVSHEDITIEVPIVMDHWLNRFITALVYFCKSKPTIKVDGNLTAEIYTFDKRMLARDFDVILTLIDYTINRKTKRFLNANGFIKFLLDQGFNANSIFSLQHLVRNSVKTLRSAGFRVMLLEPK